MMSCPSGPLMSAAVASVEQRRKSSLYGFMVTKVKMWSASSMKLGPKRRLMDRGRW